MNDFLINTNVPVILCSNMLYFRDNNRSVKLDGDLLKTMTNYKFNIDHSNPQDRKLIYEFGEEMKFDIKQKGRPSIRDKSMKKLLDSPAIMASGISNTIVLPPDPYELCDRFKLLQQEKQAGNNFIIIDEEIVVILDKLLEYKWKSKKQHKQILIKRNLSHTKKIKYTYSYTRMNIITHKKAWLHKYNCTYKYSYRWYTQKNIIFHINVCIHKDKKSMYKHIYL